MLLLGKIITLALFPPLLVFIGLGLAWLLVRAGRKRLAGVLAGVPLALLWLFSTPFFAQLGLNTLATASQHASFSQAQAVVILGGGVRHYAEGESAAGESELSALSLERLRAGVRWAREMRLPILATGGSPEGREAEANVMAHEAAFFFHQPIQWRETRANNTEQNAQFSAQILQRAGIKRVILVTHEWHMPRAKWLFEQAGIEAFAAPVGSTLAQDWGVLRFLPQPQALSLSTLALKEQLGYLKARLAFWLHSF